MIKRDRVTHSNPLETGASCAGVAQIWRKLWPSETAKAASPALPAA